MPSLELMEKVKTEVKGDRSGHSQKEDTVKTIAVDEITKGENRKKKITKTLG